MSLFVASDYFRDLILQSTNPRPPAMAGELPPPEPVRPMTPGILAPSTDSQNPNSVYSQPMQVGAEPLPPELLTVPDASVNVLGQNISLNPIRNGAIWALIVIVILAGFAITAFPAVQNAKGSVLKAAL